MTDLLSPSPYAYLDGLSPSERQAEIYRRQHRANYDAERDEFTGSVIDTARRARDLQAELADYENLPEMVTGTCRNAVTGELARVTIWDREKGKSVCFDESYRTMCAELCEALDWALSRVDNFVVTEFVDADDALTKARKLMEGKG